MKDGPLTKKDLDFCHWFRKYRDIYKAAERAGIAKNQARRTYERIEIQEEIERQDAVVEQERARQHVKAEGITRDLLDAELYSLIILNPKTHSGAKQRAIELGYVRAGVLQVGNTKSLDLTPPNPDDETPLPTVYQAFIPVGVPVQPIAAPGPTPILPAQATGTSPLAIPQPIPQPQAPAKPVVATEPALEPAPHKNGVSGTTIRARRVVG